MGVIDYDNRDQKGRVCPKCGANMWNTTYWTVTGIKDGVQCSNFACKCTLNELGQEVKLALRGGVREVL